MSSKMRLTPKIRPDVSGFFDIRASKSAKNLFFFIHYFYAVGKNSFSCLQNIPQDVHFPLFPRHHYTGKRSERWAELIKHSNRKLLALSAVPAKQALILRVPRNKCSSFDKSLNLGLWLWQTFIPAKISVGGGVREADLIAPAVWFTILGTVQWAICVFLIICFIYFVKLWSNFLSNCCYGTRGHMQRERRWSSQEAGVLQGGSAQVSLITLTTAAGPEQQSSRAEQSCRLSCSAVTLGNGHREESCLHYKQVTCWSAPPLSHFLMLCIFTSSESCSSKCRCNHSDSKAWKFWLGWTKSS